MSKKSQKNKIANHLTNPEVLSSAVYLSAHINNKEEYDDFVNKIQNNKFLLETLISENNIIPKYFDILPCETVADLNVFISPMVLRKIDNGLQIVDEEFDDDVHVQVDYSSFLSYQIQHTDIVKKLVNLKNEGKMPNFLTGIDLVQKTDNRFVISLEDKKIDLCTIDYEFPQTCVFVIPFVLLGNKKPIEKFADKLSVGIDLDEISDDISSYIMNDMFGDTVINYCFFDLLSNASNYKVILSDALFLKDVEKSIKNMQDTIVYYDKYPVFISFNENEHLDIRIPFMTFDMYANSVFDDEDVEFGYSDFIDSMHNSMDIISDLGLDYSFVLGQRIDFAHEPEMRKNVISKIKERSVIEGDVFLEESDHHISSNNSQDASANMVIVETLNYPIVLLTLQSGKNIIRQVNAYIMNPEKHEEGLEEITEYFSTFGGEDIEHTIIGDVLEMSYCETHLKIHGLVI